MELHSTRNLIKKVQTTLPRGVPFDLATLHGLGVSPQLAARYVQSGWLVRLGQGVYAFAGEDVHAVGAIKFLQSRVAGLHVAGKSALALQGVHQNVGPRAQWLLWGDVRFKLPDWFTTRFPGRYVGAKLFNWLDETLAEKTLNTPPDVSDGLRVAVRERALLEMLYEVGTRQGLEEARNLFDSQRNLRKELLGNLLQCCTSVKAVRLFLTWARETQLVDVDLLLQQHPLPAGSDRRWMNRLKDGTLLSLKPHG